MNTKLIINQRFGNNWASYNGDCVYVMSNLPDESIDFSLFSPPFLALYIFSDSIADLGNTDSEFQFFDGWRFHLQELYRVLKSGKHIAIHCKDTMRYMSGHGYAGLFDFPGHIIRLAQEVGFTLARWITIWKDPVIEMQRTKTYGLLHKSFRERAEVTRQGCADFVLVLGKDIEVHNQVLPPVNERVIERCVQQWTNEGETVFTPIARDIRNRQQGKEDSEFQYSFWSLKPRTWGYTDEFIKYLLKATTPGRLTTIHCTAQMMIDIVQKFESVRGWKFHSRTSLTDGSYLVTFRNWNGEFENNVVKHYIQPPDVDYQKFEIVERFTTTVNGEVETIEEHTETWREPIIRGNEIHPDYVGTNSPIGWRDQGYYSILTWQRYASPVWFDLEGLPATHPDCWMDIVQTNVLNYKAGRSEEEEKHICPLQLDLIERLILEYTKPGEIVLTPYGGIGSEGVTAVKLNRYTILAELKPEYFRTGIFNLIEAEISRTQEVMI